jgi:hypothetical protein
MLLAKIKMKQLLERISAKNNSDGMHLIAHRGNRQKSLKIDLQKKIRIQQY